MQYPSLSASAGLFALNVAVASIVLCCAAIAVGFLVRRTALPLRHGLLCVALTLILTSPLPIWIASEQGFGIVPIAIDVPNRETLTDAQPSDPTARAVGEATLPVQPPASREHSRTDEAIMSSEFGGSSTDQRNSQARERSSGSASADRAEAVSWLTPRPLLKLPDLEAVRRVGVLLALVWAAVAAGLVLRQARGLFVVRQLQRSLRPATDPRLIRAARRALVATARQRCTPICESRLAPVPLTLGWWRSVIVMPAGLAESLDDEQLGCVVAHEAAHVARHDTAIALLQQLAGVGFWWNPLLRALNRQINRLRERICDDHVVRQFGDGLPLAQAIVKVAEWSAARDVTLPLATTLLDDGDNIEQRIRRLTQPDRKLSLGLNRWSASLIGLFAIILAAVPLFPAMRAQQVASPKADAASRQADWQVRIRTVDAEGKPIANPRIGVQLGGEDEPLWQNGDRDGYFTATVPTRTPRYCYLLARAAGYAPMRAFWRNSGQKSEDALPAEFIFEMPKAITVGGVVLDEDGQPVPEATVLFSAGDHESNPARRAKAVFHQEKFTTDQQGQWRCDLAPATISSASINVNHPDYAIDPANYSQDQRIAELRALKHSWTLKKGFAVTGRLVDTEGSPVVGAKLAVGELNLYSHEGPFAQTDAEGRYRFERVSPRYDLPSDDDPIRFTVSALKSGFMPAMESVPGYGKRPLNDSTKQERVVNFTLRRGVTLTLRVVDTQNRPVKGAWVIPASWRGTTALGVLRQFGIPTETDEQGYWRWTDVPPGESIGYDVVKRGFTDVRNQVFTVSDAALEETIVLRQPQIVTGTVIDARTRQPIKEFVVERAFEEVAGHVNGLYWTSDATRGKSGKYRKLVTMPPHNGSYTYRALAEGYETAISESTPFTEGEVSVNFELQPKEAVKPDEPTASIHVRGRAKNLAGEPIAGATVHLVSTNGIDRRLGETKTDAEGRYEFRDVQLPLKQPPQANRAGSFQVYGEADGLGFAWHGMRHYLPQPRPQSSPKENDQSAYYQGEPIEMDLTFRAEAKLLGSVRDEKGQPVADARISLSSLDYLDTKGHELHHNYREFWAMYYLPSHDRQARSGADGRFEFSGLPAETVGYVTVEHPRFATQTFYAAITDQQITEYRFIRTASVSISNGKQVHTPNWATRKVRTGPLAIRLESTGRIAVRVIHDDDGTPAQDVRVVASSGDATVGTHARQQTNAQGQAELALPPGKYRLVADPPRDTDYVRTYSEFEVRTAAGEQTHQVRLKAGCVLILEAVDAADGSAIPGVSFWCDDEGKMGRRLGVQSSTTYVDNPVTNAQGELRAVVLPGTRHYGAGWSPLPSGYRADPNSAQLVKCQAGKTVRVQFKLSR